MRQVVAGSTQLEADTGAQVEADTQIPLVTLTLTHTPVRHAVECLMRTKARRSWQAWPVVSSQVSGHLEQADATLQVMKPGTSVKSAFRDNKRRDSSVCVCPD